MFLFGYELGEYSSNRATAIYGLGLENRHEPELLLPRPRHTHEASSQRWSKMSNYKLNVVCADCPYCDGENVIVRPKSGHGDIDLANHEIACKYCRSLFTLSESKPRIRSLSKQEIDAA